MSPSFTSRRRLLAMLGVVTAGGSAALLAACGGEAAPAAAPAKAEPTKAPAAAAPTTAAAAAAPNKAPEPTKAAAEASITFHSRGGPPTGQEVILYEEQMPLFMKKFPNIKVKHEGFTGEDYVKKVTVLLASNSIGDAMWTAIGDGSIYNFAAMKAIIALDDLAAKEKFDLGQYYAGALAGMKRDGKLYGLPFKSHPGLAVMFYNKSLLESKGVTEPTKDWTLDQLVENAKKVTTDGVFGYDPLMDQKTFLALTRAHGGELIDAEGKKSQLNSPEAIAAITWLYEAVNKHKITPTPDQWKDLTTDAKAFGAAKVAMLRRGTSFQIAAGQEVKDQFKWFVTAHPKGPKGIGGSDYEADGYSVTAASKNSGAAWEWVKWLTNQESGIRLGEIGGTVGGRPDVYKSDRLISKQPERKVFVEVMEAAQPGRPAYNTRFSEYRTAMHEALMPLWTGKETPSKSFLDNANGVVQAILDKPLPS
ncbi:MAG: ABC transporter substrate-binding protein [Chloroflexota bacterium]